MLALFFRRRHFFFTPIFRWYLYDAFAFKPVLFTMECL